MKQCKINGVEYLFLSFDVQQMFFHRVIYHCLNVSVIVSVKFNYNQSCFRYDVYLKLFSFNFQICL